MNPLRMVQTTLFPALALNQIQFAIKHPPTLSSVVTLLSFYGDIGAYNLHTTLYIALINLRLYTLLYKREDDLMTERKKKKNTWRGFLDVSLTKANKEEISEYLVEPEAAMFVVADLTKEGYRISFEWDLKKRCFAVRMTGEYTKKNSGYSMSARAKTPLKALRVLCFKHTVLCQGGAWATVAPEDDDFMD